MSGQILCAVTFALSLALVALNGFRGLWYIYVFRFLILFSSIIPIRWVITVILCDDDLSRFVACALIWTWVRRCMPTKS